VAATWLEQPIDGANYHSSISTISDHDFATGVFSAPGYFSNGNFQLQAQGMAGGSYIFQGTTDFVHWTSLGTNLAQTTSSI